jgi:hypothetical protein
MPAHVRDLPHIGRSRLRAAHAAGLLIMLRRGVVLPVEVWQQSTAAERHLLMLRAALLSYPGAWASHQSALLLQGVDVVRAAESHGPPRVHISRTGTTVREAHLIVHGQSVPDGQVIEFQGLWTSSVVRASIEAAAQRSIPYAAAVIDAGMRATIVAGRHLDDARHAVLRPDLREAAIATWDDAVAPYSRHRWVTTVREALRLADPASESVLESYSRVQIDRAGLPHPACGVPMRGDNGVLYWLDFWWADSAVIGEADGLVKYADAGASRRKGVRA